MSDSSQKKFEFNKVRSMLGRAAEDKQLNAGVSKGQIQSKFDELVKKGYGDQALNAIKKHGALGQQAVQSDVIGKFGDETVKVLGHGPEDMTNQLVKGMSEQVGDLNRIKGHMAAPLEEAARIKGRTALTPTNVATIVPGSATKGPGSMISKTGQEFVESMNSKLKAPWDIAKSAAGKKVGKKMLAALAGPAIGLGSALASGDLLAATPIGESELAGEGSDITPKSVYDGADKGYMSPERFQRLRQLLKK